MKYLCIGLQIHVNIHIYVSFDHILYQRVMKQYFPTDGCLGIIGEMSGLHIGHAVYYWTITTFIFSFFNRGVRIVI